MLDILSAILAAFLAIAVIDIIAVAVIGFLIYRFLVGLDAMQRAIVTAFLIVSGLVLIITVIGAEIGVITILVAVFATALSVVRPIAEEDG